MKTALQKFHFIGICGTAMGSVAGALRQRGFKVSGSDENFLSADVDLARAARD